MADAFPISGQIDPKAFPFLLMDLHRNGATGSLKVDGPSYQKALYFRSGRVLFASSNDPRDQLGAILIEEGKLTPEQLEDVNAKVGPGNPLAKVLAENGYVNQRELGDAARTKVERILSDVLAYEIGSFEFEDGVLPKGAVDLKLSNEKLLLAAVRRIPERSFVLRVLGGLDAVLSPLEDCLIDASEIQAETAVLLNQIDGRRSIKEAAAQSSLEEFDAAKLACALLLLGVVEKTSGGSAELDLAGTARNALGDSEAPPPAFDDDADAFAVRDEPPNALAAPSDSEPLGFYADTEPAPPPFSKAAESIPVPPPPPVAPPPEPTIPTPTRVGGLPLIPPPPRTDRPALRPATVQDIPSRQPPSRSQPSRGDLEALDAILGKSAYEGPLNPFDKPAPNRAPATPTRSGWEPRFGQSVARRGRPERRANPLLFGIAAAALVGALGGGYWYFFIRPNTAAPRTASAAASRPSPTTVPLAPTAIPPSPTMAATTPLPTHAPPTTAPAPTPTPLPSPPPTPAPTPTVGPHAGGEPLSEARDLLRKGQYAQAARAFAAHVKSTSPRTYSVQILVACADDTVEKAVRAVSSPDLFIVPTKYQGRSCYRMCWGLYESETRADSASHSVPGYFLTGGARPKVIPALGLLR